MILLFDARPPEVPAPPVVAPSSPHSASGALSAGSYRAATTAPGQRFPDAWEDSLAAYVRILERPPTLLLINVQDAGRYPGVPGLRVQVAAYIRREVWGLADDPAVRR